MGAAKTYVHKLSTGEISQAGLARTDQERTKLAAEIQENLMPHVIGKGQVRPGTQYLGVTKSNFIARLMPFVKAVDDSAFIELTSNSMRVWVDDVVISRAAVTSSVTNGDFGSAAGWTLTTTGDATANINSTVAGALYMTCPNSGGTASCVRSVTTTSAGTEHALRIDVMRGPVTFRCGSTSGGDQYISETSLDTGTHSLAFTPSGTYYVYFLTKNPVACVVGSITVEAAGAMELDTPWGSAVLREIRAEQSGDIIFMSQSGARQKKIERRGLRSWSIVDYLSEDGPFTAARTAQVRLKPNATYGNTTLDADTSFFRTTHVGSLFRLTHESMDQSAGLGGDDQFTEGLRVSGITPDNKFTIDITGTWVGTLTLQRSYDGRDGGFIDTTTTYAANGTYTITPTAAYDNVIHYYRLGFKEGDYTSGSAQVKITYSGDSGSGVCRVTGYTSSTQVSIEVLTPFRNTVYTKAWLEGAWSDKRGWPSAVAFFDGRLWFGGSDKVWGSVSDNFYSFSLDVEGDSGSIQRNVATGGQTQKIQWMLPLQRLILGSGGAESSVRSSNFDEPLSPTNMTIKDASTQGVAALSPVKLDSRGVFVHRDGASSWEIVYDFESNDYRSTDLTRLNEDIAESDIFEIAVQRSPETYIWHVLGNGECAVLLYDVQEKVAAWWRYVTEATIYSVCVLPGSGQDRVYMMTERNGFRIIEKLAKHNQARGGAESWMADAYTFSAGPTTTLSAPHLAGLSGLVGWGTTGGVAQAITGLSANGSGTITLPATYTNVIAGQAYDWRFKSAKLAFGSESGSAIMENKRVSQIGILCMNTHRDAVEYGQTFDRMHKMPKMRDGVAQASTTVYSVFDEITFPFEGSWDSDSRVCLKGSAPYPATLNGLLVKMETEDK